MTIIHPDFIEAFRVESHICPDFFFALFVDFLAGPKEFRGTFFLLWLADSIIFLVIWELLAGAGFEGLVHLYLDA